MKVITTGLLNRFWTKGIKPWLDKRIKSYADLMVTTASGYTPDALAVKEGFTELNGKLGNIYISDITSEINTDYVDGSVYVYSTNRTIRVIAKLTAKEDIPAWTHIINNLGWSGDRKSVV